MADGSPHTQTAARLAAALTIDEAISRLEAGRSDGLIVDLGAGRLARADGHRGAAGLLQRLRSHRVLVALSSGGADRSAFAGAALPLTIAPEVQEILAAIAARPKLPPA